MREKIQKKPKLSTLQIGKLGELEVQKKFLELAKVHFK